jgi:hypothetical protein
MSDTLKPQVGEGTRAYEARVLYLKMGPKRSIAKVAEHLGKSEGLLQRWSTQWKWGNFAKSWDEQQTNGTHLASDPSLDALIDRILLRQQRMTPYWLLRSRAMQAIAEQLDTALQGDDTTLRSVVSEVLATLDDLILWQDDAT